MDNSVSTIAPSFEIKDDRFDINQIADCQLLIEVSKERFRFSVYNSLYEVIMWLEDYHINSLLDQHQLLKTLNTLYSRHLFLAANYWKSIKVLVSVNHFTLMPEEFYDSLDAHKYLNFASGKNLSETEQIADYPLPFCRGMCIFGIEKEIYAWFRQMYPAKNIVPIPVVCALLDGIVQDEMADGLHLYFEEHHVTIVFFNDGKLILCNRFLFRTSDDLIYHVLFVMNELSLSNDIPVMLYGEITSFADAYLQLSLTLEQIRFANNPKKARFSQYFDELFEHRYYTLFSALHL